MNALKFFALIIFAAAICTGCSVSNAPKHLSTDEAAKIMATEKNFLIVDVRTQEEYNKRHIPNAILVPIEDIRADKLNALPDKNQTLLLYCWTGRRAEDAAEILVKHGYKKVYEFGGLVDWKGKTESSEVGN
ncbi:MAG: rhodanese-like domain-containing protein [Selenomonadaceae bacterium]|nr:rhodanese-like domain-containing protein [Selenomonadaceae bacterium]